jgi:hypothetical protein
VTKTEASESVITAEEIKKREEALQRFVATLNNSLNQKKKTLTERYNSFINGEANKPEELTTIVKIMSSGTKPYLVRKTISVSAEYYVHNLFDGSFEIYPLKDFLSRGGLFYIHRDLFKLNNVGKIAVQQPAVVKQISDYGELTVIKQGEISY